MGSVQATALRQIFIGFPSNSRNVLITLPLKDSSLIWGLALSCGLSSYWAPMPEFGERLLNMSKVVKKKKKCCTYSLKVMPYE